VHPAGGKLDHEQHVQTLEQHRVEVEEVGRQDGFGLRGQELSPRQSRAVRRRLDADPGPAAATPCSARPAGSTAVRVDDEAWSSGV
jgi:hypothetical protein